MTDNYSNSSPSNQGIQYLDASLHKGKLQSMIAEAFKGTLKNPVLGAGRPARSTSAAGVSGGSSHDISNFRGSQKNPPFQMMKCSLIEDREARILS